MTKTILPVTKNNKKTWNQAETTQKSKNHKPTKATINPNSKKHKNSNNNEEHNTYQIFPKTTKNDKINKNDHSSIFKKILSAATSKLKFKKNQNINKTKDTCSESHKNNV